MVFLPQAVSQLHRGRRLASHVCLRLSQQQVHTGGRRAEQWHPPGGMPEKVPDSQNIDFLAFLVTFRLGGSPRNNCPRWPAKTMTFEKVKERVRGRCVHMSQIKRSTFSKVRPTSEWSLVLQTVQVGKISFIWLFKTRLFCDFFSGKRRPLVLRTVDPIRRLRPNLKSRELVLYAIVTTKTKIPWPYFLGFLRTSRDF